VSHVDPEHIELRNVGIADLLWRGYQVWPYQTVMPKDWKPQRYDLVAAAAPGATPDQLREMFRNLLGERLKFQMHLEMQERNVYAMTVAKGGVRMQKTDMDPNTDAYAFPITASNNGQEKTVKGKLPTKYFPLMFNIDLDRPLVDQTGLKEVYEFDVHYTPMPMPVQLQNSPMSADDLSALRLTVVASLASAMEKQLGLHLEARKAPIDMMVIDHIETTPAEN
jgi:uncharacterized protein (TIGR03435 family)